MADRPLIVRLIMRIADFPEELARVILGSRTGWMWAQGCLAPLQRCLPEAKPAAAPPPATPNNDGTKSVGATTPGELVGRRAALCGLIAKAVHLNGRKGTVRSYNPDKDRLVVTIDDMHPGAHCACRCFFSRCSCSRPAAILWIRARACRCAPLRLSAAHRARAADVRRVRHGARARSQTCTSPSATFVSCRPMTR